MNMNFTYLDIRMMPTRYRQWYIKRLVKHFEKRESMYNAGKSSPSKNQSDMSGFDKFNDMINKKFS